jgi:hypothetical protein
MKLEISRQFFERKKIFQIPNSVKILPAGVDLFYSRGQRDKHGEVKYQIFAILRALLTILDAKIPRYGVLVFIIAIRAPNLVKKKKEIRHIS